MSSEWLPPQSVEPFAPLTQGFIGSSIGKAVKLKELSYVKVGMTSCCVRCRDVNQELQVLVVRAPNEVFAMGLTVLRFVTNVVLPITLSKAVQERSN